MPISAYWDSCRVFVEPNPRIEIPNPREGTRKYLTLNRDSTYIAAIYSYRMFGINLLASYRDSGIYTINSDTIHFFSKKASGLSEFPFQMFKNNKFDSAIFIEVTGESGRIINSELMSSSKSMESSSNLVDLQWALAFLGVVIGFPIALWYIIAN